MASSLTPKARTFSAAVLVIVVAFAAYFVYVSLQPPGSVTSGVPSSFTVNGKTFVFTYVATTQQEREQGLMNTKVTNQTTMLFVFPSSGRWSFWMYDTNTSLDMIWVNAAGNSGKVAYLVASAPPCYNSNLCTNYTPTQPANYVIEAKAGFAAYYGISVGTTVHFG